MKYLTKLHSYHGEDRYNESFYNGDVMKDQFRISDEYFDDPCFPRYQFTRIKYSQISSGFYMLQVSSIL